MKKYIYAFIATVCLPFSTQAQVAINETNFPDANFRAAVEAFDTDGEAGLSEAEIAAVTKLDLQNKGIADLTGLQYFTAVKTLYLQYNKFTAIDVSALTELSDFRIAQTKSEAGQSKLTTLDVSNNLKLNTLYCAGLGLTSLDVSNNTALQYLQCPHNNLTSLDVRSNTKLLSLICSHNPITSLDVTNNKQLTYALELTGCEVSELDLSNNKILRRLYCEDNNLTSIDLTNNAALTGFRCSNNHLEGLDVTMLTNLNSLECYNCDLTELDLTKCVALTILHCNNNHLATLDLSKNTNLRTIDVDGQEIESDAYVLDREKIAIEITPSINLAEFTTDMFTNLTNGKANTFTFTDGEQEYIYDEDSEAHFLVIAKPTTGKDIDLRDHVVKYEFDVQNTNKPNETMSVTVTIPYPYIMYVNPLTETEIKEVGDPTQGGTAENEKFYSGTIYLDYDSYVDYGAELYAATGIEESNLEDMLHGGQNPTPKQIILQKSDLYDILPSETPAYVKTWEPGYYGFNRFDETKIEMPQVKQVRKAPAAKSKIWEVFIETAAENFEGNKLQGTLTDLSVDYQSVLTLGREMGIGDNGTGVVGFWRYRGDKVAAHRAYLPADLLTNPNGGDVKGLALKFANDATGIRQIESNEESGAWYNLQGVQMAAPTQKGIYIRNGKKLIVR